MITSPVPEPILRLVHRWLGTRDFVCSRATSGVSTEVYRVEQGSAVRWLRLAEDPGENRIAEIRVHQLLRERGAQVPDILLFEPAPPEIDRSAALTSHIPGIPLAKCTDPAIARTIAIAAGHDLAIINSLPVTGFGWIDMVSDDHHQAIIAQHPVRAGWTAEFFTAIKELAPSGFVDPRHIPHLTGCMHAWAGDEFETHSHLAHGDFDSSHIFFDPASGEYTGIIDFGEGRGTHTAYDAGHLLLHDGQSGTPAIYPAVLEGYGNPGFAFQYQAHLYAIAIATRQLAIFLNRPNPAYRQWLANRLATLLADPLVS
jgi:hypothetical protein